VNVIECEGLVKKYGSMNALDHISFSIKENSITGLIGRNGAGKTTLLKLLVGFQRETEGTIKVFDRRPFNNLEVSMNSIFVDDMMSYTYTLNLKEILNEAQAFYPNWDVDLAERMLAYFNFDPKFIHQNLSKGKRSTFNMIVGLAAKCPLTIFDEPTTGMDAAVRKDFYRALLKDYLLNPRTIIISSHHLDEMEDILEDILLLNEGKKVLQIPVDELKEYAVTLSGKTAVVMQYLQDKEVIYKRNVDIDNCSVIVRNNFSHAEVKQLGINVASITPSDLCVYLTQKQEGGIDDVFNKSK
jgi:ABC-2 type transport system ATP-binding protein